MTDRCDVCGSKIWMSSPGYAWRGPEYTHYCNGRRVSTCKVTPEQSKYWDREFAKRKAEGND